MVKGYKTVRVKKYLHYITKPFRLSLTSLFFCFLCFMFLVLYSVQGGYLILFPLYLILLWMKEIFSYCKNDHNKLIVEKYTQIWKTCLVIPYLQCYGKYSIFELNLPRPEFFKPSLNFTTLLKLSFIIIVVSIHPNYITKFMERKQNGIHISFHQG